MKKVAFKGLFLAVALLLSYVESLIPFGFGIPGIKLGLANLAVVLCMYSFGAKDALVLNITRIVLSGFLFGNLYSILYGMAGGMLSFLIMYISKKSGAFSIKGVSALGGISHNIGQIAVAYFVVRTAGVFYYIPWLLLSGVLTGFLIGCTAKLMFPYLKKIVRL